MDQYSNIQEISKTLRYWILKSTTQAQSGHPTSSMSAVELMATLMFAGFFKFNISDPKNIYNDSLVFSKGHASPLFYSLWAAARGLDYEELMSLRKLNSRLEGHPTKKFPFTIAPTGSLGQGLSVGVGIALSKKYLDKVDSKSFVLLGDGELEEGQVWEAAQIASKYKLSNLIAIVDVNRLEQAGETLHEWDIKSISNKFEAFGWKTLIIEDGHNLQSIALAYEEAFKSIYLPVVIIAKTVKGKGYPAWENELNYHSKVLKEADLVQALDKLGQVNVSFTLPLTKPEVFAKLPEIALKTTLPESLSFDETQNLATKAVYGKVLNYLKQSNKNIVALDAGVKNSTMAQDYSDKNQDSFFEMFIAEQNMVSVAVGLATTGKVPFVSTFATFFTRAFDQIRMASQSNENIKLVGSYCGVSIGMDGQSQMGLEDIAMIRALNHSVVLYPSDIYSMKAMMELALAYKGLVYIRATREPSKSIYNINEKFTVGGFKTFENDSNSSVVATVISAGITLQEALIAQEQLENQGTNIQVIDLYSIKPIDFEKLKQAIKSNNIVIVEDHFPQGGIGEAVMSGLINSNYKFKHLAVKKQPMSGLPAELLKHEELDSQAIIKACSN